MPSSMEIPTFDQLYQKLLEDEEYILTELEVLVYANEINRVAWSEDYLKIRDGKKRKIQISIKDLKSLEYFARIATLNKGPEDTNSTRVHKQVKWAIVNIWDLCNP
jgi:hypothetical protein